MRDDGFILEESMGLFESYLSEKDRELRSLSLG